MSVHTGVCAARPWNVAMSDRALLEVKDLEVQFALHGQGVVRAVDGVSFTVGAGRSVAIVGESGSGKTVTGQAVMGILPGSAQIIGGQILFRDPAGDPGTSVDLAALAPDSSRFRRVRGGRISMIFQEPMTSLSPLHTVGNQIGEAVRLHRHVGEAQAAELAADMLGRVGFPDPRKALQTYPFELSGGLRQRAMIAMALVCRPALLIADEPTTALDVTIQAQILQLIKALQTELGMALLLITHDLGVVANMADEVVVIYNGEVMERGGIGEIYNNPGHPYLQALMKAVPRVGMAEGERLTPIRALGHAQGAQPAPGVEARVLADAAGPILSVQHVGKSFGMRRGAWMAGSARARVKVVHDVCFEVGRGECLGLVGESGCGKTTLSKIIMRAVAPDCGEIVYSDKGR